MAIIARAKPEQNRATADPWTVVHFGFGLMLGLMEVPLRWAVGAAVAYEVAEQVLERQHIGQQLFKASGPERFDNAALDVAVFVLGHRAGRAWNRT